MRTSFVRRRRQVPWGNIAAGCVAMIMLTVLALSPWIATKAIAAVRHHQDAKADAAANHINQDVRDKGLEFVVHSARCSGADLVASDGTKLSSPYGGFCVVDLTVRNDGTESAVMSQEEQQATGSRGAVYLSDVKVDSKINGGNPAINPGGSRDAKLVYDVPVGIVLIAIDLHGSPYSRGVPVRL